MKDFFFQQFESKCLEFCIAVLTKNNKRVIDKIFGQIT